MTHIDLKTILEYREQEQRLRKFKEQQWDKNFGFNPLLAAAWTCRVGTMFAIALLFITSIVVK
jgi:hypothetical protein